VADSFGYRPLDNGDHFGSQSYRPGIGTGQHSGALMAPSAGFFFFFFFGDFIAKKRYDFLFSARTKVVEVCNGRSRHGMRLAGRVDPRAHWVDSWRALSGSPTPLLSDFMECA
jgi:hypothetical protein